VVETSFAKVPKRRPFTERIAQVGAILNEKGVVTRADVTKRLGLSPNYALQILRWAAEKYNYAKWDEETEELYIPERKEGEAKKT
jgi:hypothetical protein